MNNHQDLVFIVCMPVLRYSGVTLFKASKMCLDVSYSLIAGGIVNDSLKKNFPLKVWTQFYIFTLFNLKIMKISFKFYNISKATFIIKILWYTQFKSEDTLLNIIVCYFGTPIYSK